MKAERGTVSGSAPWTISSVKREEDYTLNAVGEWTTYLTKVESGGNLVTEWDHDRAHNNVNEITGMTQRTGNWKVPAHDARGNMTTVPKPNDPANAFACKYDAWNRLTEVREGGIVVAEYRYDAMNRRTVKLAPHTVEEATHWHRTDVYYNRGWQGLEERFADDVAEGNKGNLATAVKVQWVWSLRYIDAPICRDRDADGQSGNGLEERLFYTTDANMNVTALVNTSASVVERYLYDPYGKPTFMGGSWTPRTPNASAYANEILFCGYRYNPETGEYDVRYRPLHPLLGRWFVRDPLAYRDSMSLAAYVSSNPIIRMDPFGLRWENREPMAEYRLIKNGKCGVLKTYYITWGKWYQLQIGSELAGRAKIDTEWAEDRDQSACRCKPQGLIQQYRIRADTRLDALNCTPTAAGFQVSARAFIVTGGKVGLNAHLDVGNPQNTAIYFVLGGGTGIDAGAGVTSYAAWGTTNSNWSGPFTSSAGGVGPVSVGYFDNKGTGGAIKGCSLEGGLSLTPLSGNLSYENYYPLIGGR